MKFKVSKKEMKNGYNHIISIGYCDLQSVLYNYSANAYNCGVNGWNCDFYILENNLVISTGYNPIGKDMDYSFIRNLDNKARNFNGSYEERVIFNISLLNELIEEYNKTYKCNLSKITR